MAGIYVYLVVYLVVYLWGYPGDIHGPDSQLGRGEISRFQVLLLRDVYICLSLVHADIHHWSLFLFCQGGGGGLFTSLKRIWWSFPEVDGPLFEGFGIWVIPVFFFFVVGC